MDVEQRLGVRRRHRELQVLIAVKRFLFVLLCLTSTAFGGPLTYPSDEYLHPVSTYYTSGVGSTDQPDGPIVNPSVDATGISDSWSAIQTAINNAGIAGNDTVVKLPAGEFRLDGTLSNYFTGNWHRGSWKLRGTKDANGFPATRLKFSHGVSTGNTGAINIGPSIQWISQTPYGVIRSGLESASSTTLVVDMPTNGNGDFNDYQLGRIYLGMDYTRAWSTNDTPSRPVTQSWRFFTVRTVGYQANTPTTGQCTITLEHPLPYAFTAAERAGAIFTQAYAVIANVVIEDVIVDCTNCVTSGTGDVFAAVMGGTMINCTFRNVRIVGANNYQLYLNDFVRVTMERCYIEDSPFSGPNHSGVLVAAGSQSMFRHNIVRKNFPGWEVNYGTTGCVFAFNYSPQTPYVHMISNHSPFNQRNVYEGNRWNFIQSDRYHSGNIGDIIAFNWCDGQVINAHPEEGGPPIFQYPAVSLNRFARYHTVVGNIWYFPSVTVDQAPYSFGNPNMGNGYKGALIRPSLGQWWQTSDNGAPIVYVGTLTTRTTDRSGQVTFDSTTGAKILADHNAAVPGGSELTHTNDARQFVWVGFTSNVLTFSNLQSDLPTLGSSVSFRPGPAGYQEEDGDVSFTTYRKWNYRYASGGASGIVSGETTSDTAPDSYYLTVGSDPLLTAMGLTRSPYRGDSMTSAPTEVMIPAGYAYANNRWPDAAESAPVIYAPKRPRLLRR